MSGLMFGGGQKVVMDLAAEAESTGVNANVVLLGCRQFQLDGENTRVVPYDGRYNRPLTLLQTSWKLRALLRRDQPPLLHTHGWDADVIGWLARLGLGIQQLVHLHVTADWLGKGGVKQAFRRWLTRLAFRHRGCSLVAVSGAVRRHWVDGLGISPDCVRVVHNGIDIERFFPQGQDPAAVPVVGVAARLAPMKGIEYLIEALGTLGAEEIEFQLRIAGTGSLRESLEVRCGEAGILHQTEFLGHVEDMPGFYRTIDLFALPSISTEGLPLGVLEAMACGLPVVATTVGGTPEALRDGIEGLLVPPRDSAALAGALRRLLVDPRAREAMGRAGRARAVECFSLERFSSQIFALYHEILGESPG